MFYHTLQMKQNFSPDVLLRKTVKVNSGCKLKMSSGTKHISQLCEEALCRHCVRAEGMELTAQGSPHPKGKWVTTQPTAALQKCWRVSR